MMSSTLQRRTPLRTTTPLQRHTPIRKQSKKRAQEQRERTKMVNALLSANPWCQIRLPGCEGRAIDVHETLTRARGGSITDPTITKTTCRNCHTRVHTDTSPGQRDMHERGLLVHSWDRDGGEPT